MTNYEKIKAMPLQEMAEWINKLDILEIEYCKSDCEWMNDDDIPEGECIKCAERWLEEEAECISV